jgi:hypothetical protein
MPIKSKAQMRKLAVLEKQGKVPEGTLHRWAEETPNMKSLPERKGGGKRRGKGKKAAKARKGKKT